MCRVLVGAPRAPASAVGARRGVDGPKSGPPGMLQGDAVITELRRLVRLPDILHNYLTLLPPSWTVHFVHGRDNHLWVHSSPGN